MVIKDCLFFNTTQSFYFHQSTQTQRDIGSLKIRSSRLTPFYETVLFQILVIRLYLKRDFFEGIPHCLCHLGVVGAPITGPRERAEEDRFERTL